MLELVGRRRGRAVIGHTDEHPWLLSGGVPGRPLSPERLRNRLDALGIPARRGRNAALMDLAGELPAAVLSQLLNLSITRATIWTQEAGQTRPCYAAEVIRRHHAEAGGEPHRAVDD